MKSNTQKQINFNSIVDYLICLHIIFLYCFDGMQYLEKVSNVIYVLFIIATIVNIGSTGKKFRINLCVFISIFYLVYCFTLKEWIQGYWSQLFGLQYQTAISILLSVVGMLCIYIYADTEEIRYRILHYIAIAGLWLAAVTFAIVRTGIFKGLHAHGMESVFSHYGLNTNTMGSSFGLSFIACIGLYEKYKDKKYIFYAVINSLFGLLCGSRKGWIYLLVGWGLFKILSTKRKKVLRIVAVAFSVYILYLIVMNIPVLYELFGRRIQSLIDVLNGGMGTDSTRTRYRMIQYGLDLYKDKKIFGYGFNAFSVLYGKRYGVEIYSHNNYVEMLVSGGIVLVTLYYSRFLLVIKQLIKKIRVYDESKVYFIIAIIFLICDMAAITYYYKIYYVAFALIMSAAYNNVKTETKIEQ